MHRHTCRPHTNTSPWSPWAALLMLPEGRAAIEAGCHSGGDRSPRKFMPDQVTAGQWMRGRARGAAVGSTDLGGVGGPGVDPPEQLAAGDDLHGLLDLGLGVGHVAVSSLGTAVLKRTAAMWAQTRARTPFRTSCQPRAGRPPTQDRPPCPACGLSVLHLRQQPGSGFRSGDSAGLPCRAPQTGHKAAADGPDDMGLRLTAARGQRYLTQHVRPRHRGL